MRNDEHGPPFGNPAHVLLNDPLALVVERTRRLIEDQNTRIGYKRTRDRDRP